MKGTKGFKKITAIFAAVIMIAMSVTTVFAATTDNTPNTIDTDATGSMTIYKYDLTAAEKAGVTGYGTTAGTGEKNETVETALENYALAGVQFSYEKVGDIYLETTPAAGTANASVQVKYTIPEALETALGITSPAANHKYSSDELNTYLDNVNQTVGGKNAIEAYMNASAGKTELALTNGKGMTSATGLAVGLYLVVETKVPEEVQSTTNPFFVSIPMTDATGDKWLYDVTVYPKNQTDVPAVDKIVKQSDDTESFHDTTSASTGDTLDYRIVSKLPKITSTSTYLTKYTFVDTLCGAIEYKGKETVTVNVYDTETEAKAVSGSTATIALVQDDDYTVTYGTDATDSTKTTMTIVMTESGLAKLNPAASEKYMAVSYQATVKGNAVLGDNGNPNDVDLTYSRTNTSYDETIKDEAKVYTYGINLKKNFSGTDADATAVKFTLERIRTNADGSEAVDGFVTSDFANNIYTMTGLSDTATTEYSPLADGTLNIRGLEAGTYRLTEIKTAGGYQLLKNPIYITITSSSQNITPSQATRTGIDNPNANIIFGTTTEATAKVNEEEAGMSEDNGSLNAKVDLAVMNNKGFELPKTGDFGTIFFTMLGAVGLAIGTVLVTRRSKTEK